MYVTIYKSYSPGSETDVEGSFRGLKPAGINDLQLNINDTGQ